MKVFAAGREIVWAAIGGLAVSIYSSVGSFIIGGDTPQYLQHSMVRPPLYPLFLDLLGRCGATLQTAVVLQSFFVAACAFYLSVILRRRFNLAPWAFLVAYFLLLVPLLPSKLIYFSMYGLIGRFIMTEAASYGIFLLTFAYMVESVYEPSLMNFSFFAALAVLNTLVRDQFLFVYVTVPIFLAWFYLKFRDGRRLALLTAAFAACLLAGRAAGALCARKRPTGAAAGNHLKVVLFPTIVFFSGPEDLPLFNGQTYYPLLEKIFLDLNAKKYFSRFHEEMNDDLVPFHDSRLPLIDEDSHRVINEVRAFAAAESWDDRTNAVLAPIADSVVPILMRKYWKDYARLATHEFIEGFTFRFGLFTGIFVVCWFRGIRRPPDIITILTAAMVMANHALVALLMYLATRHLFYTDTFALLFIVLLLGRKGASPGENSGTA